MDGKRHHVYEKGLLTLLRGLHMRREPPRDCPRPDVYNMGADSYFGKNLEVVAFPGGASEESVLAVVKVWDPERRIGFFFQYPMCAVF